MDTVMVPSQYVTALRCTRPLNDNFGVSLHFCLCFSAIVISPAVQAQSEPAAVVPTILFTAPAPPTPSFRLIPSVSLNERYTDNVNLANSTLAQSSWVTNISAGLGIDYRGGRANARLDYRVDQLSHEKATYLDTTQHFLNANASLEAIEKWLYLDARASITPQSRSAFGTAPIYGVTTNYINQVETTTYQITPRIRGVWNGSTAYFLRLGASDSRISDESIPESKFYELSGSIKNSPSAGILGWSFDANALALDNSLVDKKSDSRVRAGIDLEATTQLHLTLNAGREYSDLESIEKQTTNTFGIGLQWAPSQRTLVAAVSEKRFFGNDHLVLFTHRTPLTEWRFSSLKEVAVSSNDLAISDPASVNNILLNLLVFAIPDPIARADAARQKFEQTGLPSSSGFQQGLTIVRPYLQRRQEASVALLGARNAITLSVTRREQRAVDDGTTSTAPVAPIEQIRQDSANLAWAYRFTPLSTLRLILSRLYTKDLFDDARTSTQRLQSLYFVTRMGQYTSLSVGVQRLQFDSTVTDSYRENTVGATFSIRY